MKSTHERDIESSNAHGVWISNLHVNKPLDNAFNAGSQVILFFSVIKRYAVTRLRLLKILRADMNVKSPILWCRYYDKFS
jgi:YT521-B-like domain